ncbi:MULTISPECIES: Kiwa anti-phage protein KwaB-like domain-containing protein [Pseudomonas]|uniref:Kiwa anti-phage protein KwaB-like domain-containing protein n=1 Tax=Pseudomonas nitroreducens TaxID=46680 RepID=UPI001E567EF9|nr:MULTISPECIES: Kiwa anti-phage protein KwaB-like domain-containing protein [Pseudomonas]MCE4071531.1 DUF4868 domain-containing protein [Pseudomonas nitritireducens]MCE4081307.1 DUF4868 domain-containing protein [Pseudomonas nitroreducens]
MTAPQALAKLREFDLERAELSVWAFKKSTSNARFRASSVVATPELRAELKSLAGQCIRRCTEVDDYGLLASTNENSCLHLESDETIFSALEDLVRRPPEEHLIEDVAGLEGSVGYLVRMTFGDDSLHCVCRLASDWKIKKRSSVLNLVLNRNELDLAGDQAFSIPKRFDFFVINDDILVVHKAAFESLLEYKQTYVTSFAELQADVGFQGVFADMAVLVEYVGTNTTHLRRMAVVQERAHYQDPGFMERLRQVNQERQWNIEFDADGKIIPSMETARAIIQVLLNHRLHSELTNNDFDVASASPIG